MSELSVYTGPTSNSDNQLRIQQAQRSAAYDPVDKLRVSTPQSLIDTDFEYGQQPSKWEQLDLENNRQSCWYNQNAPIPVTAITGNGTTTVVVSTTATVAIGTPVFLEDCLDTNANGWWYVTASTGGTSFTIVTTNVVATGNQYNATATYVYAGYFYTNAGFAVAAASTTAIVTSGTAITVNTAFPHGLSVSSLVFIVGTTGGTGVNGAWELPPSQPQHNLRLRQQARLEPLPLRVQAVTYKLTFMHVHLVMLRLELMMARSTLLLVLRYQISK